MTTRVNAQPLLFAVKASREDARQIMKLATGAGIRDRAERIMLRLLEIEELASALLKDEESNRNEL